jgi:hypothetical protein
MSNFIMSDKHDSSDSVTMSDGLTSVVIAVLVLSGSDLAQTDWEKELVVWLAEKDQGIYGLGVVGFDIAEMGWTRDGFEAEKQFVLRMIEAATANHRWEALDYQPHVEWVLDRLGQFRSLIEHFSVGMIEGERKWAGERPLASEKCGKHGVYLHAEGCVICNDQ